MLSFSKLDATVDEGDFLDKLVHSPLQVQPHVEVMLSRDYNQFSEVKAEIIAITGPPPLPIDGTPAVTRTCFVASKLREKLKRNDSSDIVCS